MSKRVSMITGEKVPKKHASERTLYRFRYGHGIENQHDELRRKNNDDNVSRTAALKEKVANANLSALQDTFKRMMGMR
jgi:hypothetical protein